MIRKLITKNREIVKHLKTTLRNLPRATGINLNGSRMRLAVVEVIFGFLQQRRQQRGGVPMGQVVSTFSRLPMILRVKLMKTTMVNMTRRSCRRETRGKVAGERRTGKVMRRWSTGTSWSSRM